MFRRHRSVTGFHQVQAYGEAQKEALPEGVLSKGTVRRSRPVSGEKSRNRRVAVSFRFSFDVGQFAYFESEDAIRYTLGEAGSTEWLLTMIESAIKCNAGAQHP
jgi:hypothetical protein